MGKNNCGDVTQKITEDFLEIGNTAFPCDVE